MTGRSQSVSYLRRFLSRNPRPRRRPLAGARRLQAIRRSFPSPRSSRLSSPARESVGTLPSDGVEARTMSADHVDGLAHSLAARRTGSHRFSCCSRRSTEQLVIGPLLSERWMCRPPILHTPPMIAAGGGSGRLARPRSATPADPGPCRVRPSARPGRATAVPGRTDHRPATRRVGEYAPVGVARMARPTAADRLFARGPLPAK